MNTYENHAPMEGHYSPIKEHFETFRFPKDRNEDELLMGFEMEFELETKDRSKLYGIAERLNRNFPNIIVKYDSSLVNGFEVISAPMSLDEYRNKFDWRWLSILHNAGFMHSNDEGVVGEHGMHIHVNRKYFDNDTQIFSMSSRIIDWKDLYIRNGYFVEPSQWADARKLEPSDLVMSVAHRYLYVSPRRETVEMRMFTPSFDKNHIIECLQICEDFATVAKICNKQ